MAKLMGLSKILVFFMGQIGKYVRPARPRDPPHILAPRNVQSNDEK